MQVELTDSAQEFVDQLIADGRFQSADEAVEFALQFFRDCEPTIDTLNAKLRDAHEAHEAGESELLNMDEIKAELHNRLQGSPNA